MRLIDADALMRRIEDSARNAGLHSEDYRKIKRFIAKTPTIEVETVRHGRWTDHGECSECGQLALYNGNEENVRSRFCPHCGAKMALK